MSLVDDLISGIIGAFAGAFAGMILSNISMPSFTKLEVTGNDAKIFDEDQKKEIDAIQCSVRFAIEWKLLKLTLRSKLLAENAQGWVKLNCGPQGSQGHSSTAPWAYLYYYNMDIVGEESLVVLFLSKDCKIDSNNCKIYFTVRPNSDRWDERSTNVLDYNEIKDCKLKIRTASRNANGIELSYTVKEFVHECIDYYNKNYCKK